jgi:outer membrane lipoprotein-sorting protein
MGGLMNVNRKAAFLLAASALLGTGPVFAEAGALSKEAQAALDKASSWKSYKTDFSLETQEENGEDFSLRGTLIYQKPGQRHLQIREGEAAENTQILVSDGSVEWQYYPKGNVAYRIDNPPEAPGPHRPFTDVRPETVRFVKKVEGPGGPLLRFEAEPRPESVEGAPVPVKKVRLDLSEEDGMLREMVMLDEKDKPVLTQRFTGLELNVEVPEDQFKFTAPEGVSVMQMPPAQPKEKGGNG